MTSGVQTKIDFKTVQNYIKENGYKLHSGAKEYTNSKSRLLLECPKGHVIEMSFTTFKTGCRCRHCWKQKNRRKIIKTKFRKGKNNGFRKYRNY